MTTEEFQVFCTALDVYLSPTDRNENIDKLANAVTFIQKQTDGFNAKAPPKLKVVEPPTATEQATTR